MSDKENIYGSDPQGEANSVASAGLSNKVVLDVHGGDKSDANTSTEANKDVE